MEREGPPVSLQRGDPDMPENVLQSCCKHAGTHAKVVYRTSTHIRSGDGILKLSHYIYSQQ